MSGKKAIFVAILAAVMLSVGVDAATTNYMLPYFWASRGGQFGSTGQLTIDSSGNLNSSGTFNGISLSALAPLASPNFTGTITNGTCGTATNCVTITNTNATSAFNGGTGDIRWQLAQNGSASFGLQASGSGLTGGALELGNGANHAFISGNNGAVYLFDNESTTAPALTLSSGNPATFFHVINTPLTTPASSSAACVVGTQEADANFYYVCTATNTWKRVALTTF